jgi:hypothetical protein
LARPTKTGKRRNEVDCNHPANKRTNLSKGDGFRCEECKAVIKTVNLRGPVVQHHDLTKVTKPEATVKTVTLTKDEQERCNKHKANQRKEELKAIEGNAKHLVKLAEKIVAGQKDLLQRYGAIKILYEEAKPLVENVMQGFAHLRKGEKIMGHTTAAEWAKAEMGCTYEWLRRLRNPKPDKLIIENSGAKNTIDVTFKVVEEPTTPAPAPAAKEPEPPPTVIDVKSLAAKQEEEEVAQAEPIPEPLPEPHAEPQPIASVPTEPLPKVTGTCQARKADHKRCGEPADVMVVCKDGSEDRFCWKHLSDKSGLLRIEEMNELALQKQLAPPALPEPQPPVTELEPTPPKPTLDEWRKHSFHPGGSFRLRYFDEGASIFWGRHKHALNGVFFDKVLEKVGDPKHADDLKAFAAVLRGAAEELKTLADAVEPSEQVAEKSTHVVRIDKESQRQIARDVIAEARKQVLLSNIAKEAEALRESEKPLRVSRKTRKMADELRDRIAAMPDLWPDAAENARKSGMPQRLISWAIRTGKEKAAAKNPVQGEKA